MTTMNDADLPLMACAVCGQVVDTVTSGPENGRIVEEILGYQHTLASVDDHVVIPVAVADIRTNYRCDFCLADGARWALPVERYEMGLGHWNEGDWAACDDCAFALRNDDWNKIIYRATKSFNARHPGDLMRIQRSTYEHLYRELRTHVLGPVRIYVEPKS